MSEYEKQIPSRFKRRKRPPKKWQVEVVIEGLIDYKALLKKYMAIVLGAEGVTYAGDGQYDDRVSGMEAAELVRISNELEYPE